MVFKFAALPRLIEKCAEMMVKVAKEDACLALHDLSQLRRTDLSFLRAMSFEVTADATYRIQYIPKQQRICFMSLPFDSTLLLVPPKSSAIPSSSALKAMEEEVNPAITASGEQKNNDGYRSEEEQFLQQLPSKRLKIKL